jgi:quercetin dioxygenase-like cupin family protein
MKTLVLFISAFTVCGLATAFAQHNHATGKEVQAETPMTFAPVLSTALSDPELTYYKMESSVMTLAPGAEDTVSHRHDAELFGYVLEGSVQIALVTKDPQTYATGEMFYEKRNILHTLTRNPSQDQPAKILLVFIIKNGRAGYTPEYPEQGVK